MPYYKRRYKKRPYRKRGGLTSMFGRMRVGDVARKAYAGYKYLRGMINSEKFHITTNVAGNVTTTTSVNHLTAVAQGDADPGRSGNSILVRGLSYNYTFTISPSAVASQCRVVVVQDKQQVGDTAPAWTDVFTAATPESLMNVNTLGRFSILYDKVHVLTQTGRQSLTLRGYMKMYSHCRYNGANSTDIQKNGVYLMLVSNEATNVPTIASNWRIFYHDN